MTTLAVIYLLALVLTTAGYGPLWLVRRVREWREDRRYRVMCDRAFERHARKAER